MSGDDVKEKNMRAAVKHLRPLPGPLEEVESLFHQHHDMVFRTAYRITGSVVDAEDVLQTIFLRLVKRRPDLSPSPASYLHRAAINASLDLMRSRNRASSVPFEEIAPVITDREGHSPEAQHANRELRRIIRQSVAQLSEKTAQAVVLKYFEGYGNREIADRLGTSQMVVAVMLHRARRRLRKEIAGFLEEHHEAE